LIIHKSSLGSREVPQKIWAQSVQPFWRLLDTNKQTDVQTPKQTDKPNLYIDLIIHSLIYWFIIINNIYCCSSSFLIFWKTKFRGLFCFIRCFFKNNKCHYFFKIIFNFKGLYNFPGVMYNVYILYIPCTGCQAKHDSSKMNWRSSLIFEINCRLCS